MSLEVPVLVQRYHVDDRVYQVFRKATGPDDAAFDRRWIAVLDRLDELVEPWSISSWLTDPDSEDNNDLPDIFAFVYEDRGALPGNEGDEDDYLCIAYDPETSSYRVDVPEVEHPTVDGLTAPTLDEAIERGILEWDKVLQEEEAEE